MTSKSTFGEMFEGPDMAPPYAASLTDEPGMWAVVNHREQGKVIVAGLTEAQALTIADYLNWAAHMKHTVRD